MSGKKVVVALIVMIILTGTGMAIWIKKAYDTRPQIKIEETPK